MSTIMTPLPIESVQLPIIRKPRRGPIPGLRRKINYNPRFTTIYKCECGRIIDSNSFAHDIYCLTCQRIIKKNRLQRYRRNERNGIIENVKIYKSRRHDKIKAVMENNEQQ